MGYIKQITIQGFKTYRDQTRVEPFSSGHNVIVGRNGAGKSNFFAAIRFVLGDDYQSMTQKERVALLHEGSGAAVMSAYVEVLFDNSDDRFLTGKPELTLRRTIGQKKDEYSIDRKNATKSDVTNLLESAGFSRSNPYYIVPQGRVQEITNMKDVQRLNLLKEIAGTKVYERRRDESLNIMRDTDNRRQKIDDLLAYIHERLDELEEEKEELRAFQEKERERKCLIYTIHNRDETNCKNKLAQIEDLRMNGSRETEENSAAFVQMEEEIDEIERSISQSKQEINLLKTEKDQLDDERRNSARNKAKFELSMKELADGQSKAQQDQERCSAELQEVQEKIQAREAELEKLLPGYKAKKAEEAEARTSLRDVEGQRKRLYDKQSRVSAFKTKQQRDQHLRTEIDNANVTLQTSKALRLQAKEDATAIQEKTKALKDEIAGIRTNLDNQGENTKTIDAQVQKARDVRDNLQDQRKQLWREQATLDSQLGNAEQELRQAEHTLHRLMDHNTSIGLSTIRRLKEEHNLSGIYGTVAELLRVHEGYKVACEITAGKSLFHLVADNDETATKAITLLNRASGGRVTFLPLNRIAQRLRRNQPEIPQMSGSMPLLSKLEFDPLYEPVFQDIFGKTTVSPTLEIGSRLAREHGINAITVDGQRVDKKGVLTGGFISTQSPLDEYSRVAKWRNEVESLRTRKAQLKKQLESLDQQITAAINQHRKVDSQKQQLEGNYGPMIQQMRAKKNELQTMTDALEKAEARRQSIEKDIAELGTGQAIMEEELNSEFKKALSSDEERLLESLGPQIQDLRRLTSKASTERSALEGRKTELEVELREMLHPMRDQLVAQDAGTSAGGGDANSRLEDCQRQLKRTTKGLDHLDKQLQELDERIQQANEQLAALEAQRADKQQQNMRIAQALEKHQKRMERSMQDKTLWMEKKAEAERIIRELGTLPTEAFAKYERMDSEKATTQLKKVNDALKKYSHVNKKAFEQYASFTKQREVLTKRRAELDSSRASIEDLIQHLDTRKDVAIERTFKQVSMAFAEVFEKLVPAGKGRLIILRKSDAQAGKGGLEESSGEDEGEGRADRRRKSKAEAQTAVENYCGVAIAVSFNSKHDEQQRIQQLSGGQKSLCALALVFAIQQCDSAPFYLFDEIDAALDAQYRTAVAALIRQLSRGEWASQQPDEVGEDAEDEEESDGDEDEDEDAEGEDDDDGSANGHSTRRGSKSSRANGRRRKRAGRARGNTSTGAQFICTTFRPEMLLVAEKCYGVSYSNKTSSIDVVDREAALDFVDEQNKQAK